MALVEITANNVYAGSSLRQLTNGAVVEVDDKTAQRWIAAGKAKRSDKKEGEKLAFAVATPSAPAADLSGMQKQLADLREQNKKLNEEAKSHASELKAAVARADHAEAALAKKKEQ